MYMYICKWWLHLLVNIYTHVWANARIPLRTVLCSPNIGMVLLYGENLYFKPRPTYRSKINIVFTIRGSAQLETTICRLLCRIFRESGVCTLYIHSFITFPVLLSVHYYYYYQEFSVAIQYQPFSFIGMRLVRSLETTMAVWVSVCVLVCISNKEWVYETVREHRVVENSVRQSTR